MTITLRSWKELNTEPPKETKEVDVEIATKSVVDKAAENLRKSKYSKTKVVEKVNKSLPPPFP